MTPPSQPDVFPLIAGDDDALLLCGPASLTRGEFRRRVAALAMALPGAPFAINLCEHRDHFITAFCAAALRGQVSLLPPSRASQAVAEVAACHPNASRLIDGDEGEGFDVRAAAPAAVPAGAGGRIDPAALAMIAFTSGSTGKPSAHAKTWAALAHTDVANQRYLRAVCGGPASIVATVPPQHMYGMEMSVLLPLFGDFSVHPGRPFFPQDVARALAECPAPRLLVTTPVHLRALVESGIELPVLAAIVSATAPLSVELAAAAEQRFGCELHEAFGATEVCILAYRRTAVTARWRLLDGVELRPEVEATGVLRASLEVPVELADIVEIFDGGRSFELRGRQADLLEIAGKRASLADLTRRLQAVPGVRDGAMVQLDADGSGVGRLAAVVVTDESLEDAAILDVLRGAADPVFLPRRIVRVDALPRNETGKLPRQALLALVGRGSEPTL